jgi:hypothetical protein
LVRKGWWSVARRRDGTSLGASGAPPAAQPMLRRAFL